MRIHLGGIPSTPQQDLKLRPVGVDLKSYKANKKAHQVQCQGVRQPPHLWQIQVKKVQEATNQKAGSQKSHNPFHWPSRDICRLIISVHSGGEPTCSVCMVTGVAHVQLVHISTCGCCKASPCQSSVRNRPNGQQLWVQNCEQAKDAQQHSGEALHPSNHVPNWHTENAVMLPRCSMHSSQDPVLALSGPRAKLPWLGTPSGHGSQYIS
mmetsp:Transcript_50525/g.117965  ORF Transcript_50525/g.117965 Transcript_50525/m.117965 type:complete len:209 (+) Transcript_50525:369-995(+)